MDHRLDIVDVNGELYRQRRILEDRLDKSIIKLWDLMLVSASFQGLQAQKFGHRRGS